MTMTALTNRYLYLYNIINKKTLKIVDINRVLYVYVNMQYTCSSYITILYYYCELIIRLCIVRLT